MAQRCSWKREEDDDDDDDIGIYKSKLEKSKRTLCKKRKSEKKNPPPSPLTLPFFHKHTQRLRTKYNPSLSLPYPILTTVRSPFHFLFLISPLLTPPLHR